MKTPITDAAAQTITIDCDDSCVAIYVYESDKIYEGELVPAFVARRLELDRAALLEALSTSLLEHREVLSILQTREQDGEPVAAWRKLTEKHIGFCESALATARANFPTP